MRSFDRRPVVVLASKGRGCKYLSESYAVPVHWLAYIMNLRYKYNNASFTGCAVSNLKDMSNVVAALFQI